MTTKAVKFTIRLDRMAGQWPQERWIVRSSRTMTTKAVKFTIRLDRVAGQWPQKQWILRCLGLSADDREPLPAFTPRDIS